MKRISKMKFKDNPDNIIIVRRVIKATRQVGSVYYYQGNIYGTSYLLPSELPRVRRIVRRFTKENAAMIAADRAESSYKTIVQLFDEQMEAVDARTSSEARA